MGIAAQRLHRRKHAGGPPPAPPPPAFVSWADHQRALQDQQQSYEVRIGQLNAEIAKTLESVVDAIAPPTEPVDTASSGEQGGEDEDSISSKPRDDRKSKKSR